MQPTGFKEQEKSPQFIICPYPTPYCWRQVSHIVNFYSILFRYHLRPRLGYHSDPRADECISIYFTKLFTDTPCQIQYIKVASATFKCIHIRRIVLLLIVFKRKKIDRRFEKVAPLRKRNI